MTEPKLGLVERAARCLALGFAALLAAAVHAESSPSVPILTSDIPPQSLAGALQAFADQTGLQIVYVSQIVASQGSSGSLRGAPPEEALGRLLEGTGLAFEFLNNRTVRIYQRATRPHARSPPGAAGLAPLEEVVVNASRRMEPAEIAPVSATVWTEQAMSFAGVKGIDEIGALTPGLNFGYNSRLGDWR